MGTIANQIMHLGEADPSSIEFRAYLRDQLAVHEEKTEWIKAEAEAFYQAEYDRLRPYLAERERRATLPPEAPSERQAAILGRARGYVGRRSFEKIPMRWFRKSFPDITRDESNEALAGHDA